MKQKKLSDKLRQARAARHMTLRAIEEKSDGLLCNAYFSQIEHGYIQDVNPNILRVIARILQLDYMELMILAGYITVRDLRTSKNKGC